MWEFFNVPTDFTDLHRFIIFNPQYHYPADTKEMQTIAQFIRLICINF